MYDGKEVARLQGGPADEGAADLRHAQDFHGVPGLYRAAVKDRRPVSVNAETPDKQRPDRAMHLLDLALTRELTFGRTRLRLRGAVENLLDTRAAMLIDYPFPGRLVRAGVQRAQAPR